jgi:hypothetical protein
MVRVNLDDGENGVLPLVVEGEGEGFIQSE